MALTHRDTASVGRVLAVLEAEERSCAGTPLAMLWDAIADELRTEYPEAEVDRELGAEYEERLADEEQMARLYPAPTIAA